MLPNYLLLAAIASLATFVIFLLWLWNRYAFWKAEGKKYAADPGYVPPVCGFFGRWLRSFVGRLAAFVYLGPVRIHSRRFLSDRRRLLILGNHQTERDAIVVPRIAGLRKLRFLMAMSQVQPARAFWVALTGGIAVGHPRSTGGTVEKSARALADDGDTSMVIFPEGELHRDGELKRENFRDGSMRIARLAERLCKERASNREFAVLPIYIRYERDYARAGWMQKLLLNLGLWKWRLFFGERTFGVDIYCGSPIALKDMPVDAHEATTVIFNEIARMKKESRKSAS